MQGRYIDHVDIAIAINLQRTGTPLQGTPIVLNGGQEFLNRNPFKSR